MIILYICRLNLNKVNVFSSSLNKNLSILLIEKIFIINNELIQMMKTLNDCCVLTISKFLQNEGA
jgi:hypothetical protein